MNEMAELLARLDRLAGSVERLIGILSGAALLDPYSDDPPHAPPPEPKRVAPEPERAAG